MPMFTVAPPPKTVLGRYRILSPSASVRVSPLCFGSMSLGDAWSDTMGDMDKKTAFEMLDYFWESGGNFIDTANNYQDEQSEQWIGEWMEARQNRDEIVLATKYSTCYAAHSKGSGKILANHAGNGTKSLHLSVRASLKKLRTSYIDILYVHWWDHVTSIPELMLALNALLTQGLVLYLGISDAPAYVVAACNQYARDHGLRGFVVYQGRWSAAQRDFERDVLPLARDFGLGLAPWGALGGGYLKTRAQREAMAARGEQGRDQFLAPPNADQITDTLERIAKAKKHPRGEQWDVTSVALAYVMHKAPYVFPIVGGRKVSHLKGNIDALSLVLEEEDIKAIEDAAPFDIGFPWNLIGTKPDGHFILEAAGKFDYTQPPLPIRPAQPTEEQLQQ